MEIFTLLSEIFFKLIKNFININYFNSAADCSHLFSYSLEITEDCSVVTIIYLEKINRVAAGLTNGRLFLLDSTLIPKTFAAAEGSFVLTEIGSGEELHSACSVWCNKNA